MNRTPRLAPGQVLDLKYSEQDLYWRLREKDLRAFLDVDRSTPVRRLILERILKILLGLERCEVQAATKELHVLTRGERVHGLKECPKLSALLQLCFNQLRRA